MIRIGIVDDHAIVRSGLRQFFCEQADLQVIGEASSGREAIDLVRNAHLNVLVLDLSMPGLSGIDVISRLRVRAPDLGVLILSGYPEQQYAAHLIRHGARGYLNKDCDPHEIVDAVRTISQGQHYLTRSVMGSSIQGCNLADGVPASHLQLSEREFQVFLKLARGDTVGLIAKTLSMSVKTVSEYRTNVMRKMKLRSNSALTYYSLKMQLLQ